MTGSWHHGVESEVQAGPPLWTFPQHGWTESRLYTSNSAVQQTKVSLGNREPWIALD